MLPNHAPLVVAEQFGMLEALHPGRVDLGIGRAPGTDQVTASALRRTSSLQETEDFLGQLGDLLGFFTGSFPDDHPYRRITAVPGLGYQPKLWLLGSSDYSAQVAGLLGLPFSFAHHFAAGNTLPALAAYRAAFRPSGELDEPYAMLGVAVLCAPTDEEAEWLAGPGRLAFLRLRSGRPGLYPTPEEAAAHPYTAFEREMIKGWTASHVVGSPARCARACEPDRPNRGRRADGHDDGPRLRGPGALLRAAGRGRRPSSGDQDPWWPGCSRGCSRRRGPCG